VIHSASKRERQLDGPHSGTWKRAQHTLIVGTAFWSSQCSLRSSRSPTPNPLKKKAQACAACHGANGIPVDMSSPMIWGQHRNYLYVQLRDFNGLRKSEVMEPLTRALQRDEMMAIALYFSKLTWPGLHQPRIETPVAARALQTNASVGCTGCHMAGYQGQGVFPRLAGQSVTYLVKAMTDFRISSRSTHPVMMEFMNATSEDDLKAMAVYLTGL
jgi:cytochrome c553